MLVNVGSGGDDWADVCDEGMSSSSVRAGEDELGCEVVLDANLAATAEGSVKLRLGAMRTIPSGNDRSEA